MHAGRERVFVLGLDEQMNVRALDAQLHDPEVLSQSSGQRRLANRLVHASSAQVADLANHAQIADIFTIIEHHRDLVKGRCGAVRPGSEATPRVASAPVSETQ